MYKTGEVSDKLKILSNTLRDTSDNLKSLDYLVINPLNESRILSNHLSDKLDTANSISKIERSLENISSKQHKIGNDVERMSSVLQETNPDLPKFINYPKYTLKAASANYLDAIDSSHEVSSNVNKKLQEAQDKLHHDRLLLENRSSSFNKSLDISPDLKALLTSKINSQGHANQVVENQKYEVLNKQLTKTETENSSLKFEVDSLKRQVLSETGAKNSLLSKVENFKSKIQNLEDENIILKKELDRMTIENDVNRKKADTSIRWQEKLSEVQMENEQLRNQSRHCNHLTEMEELRRQKEKADRGSLQMKDQMTDLMKQMDSKQSHISKLMDEICDLQEKLSSSKSKLQDLDVKWNDTQNELRQRQQMYQDVVNKIESLEYSIIELETDKNKGFFIRDDNIERLEKQNARLKNETDKLHLQMQEINILMNDLHKENESLRIQLTNGHAQTDALRREMEALIKARSIQDEILKRREEENENYLNKNREMQLELENLERTSDKHKFDAEICNQDLNQARETVAVQEERIANLTATNISQHEQIVLSNAEISSLTRKCIGLENQTVHFSQQLSDLKKSEENLRYQLDESQGLKSKKLELEKENNLRKLEQLLEAEKTSVKMVSAKCERQMLEINRLHCEYWTREQMAQKYKKKCVQLKQEMDNMVKQNEVDKSVQENDFKTEIGEQEQELSLAKEKLSDVVEERDQTLRWIVMDIDAAVALFCQIDVSPSESNHLVSSNYLMKNDSIDLKSCPPTSSALSTLGGLNVGKCFIEIKAKISWIRSTIGLIINYLEMNKSANSELQEKLVAAQKRIKVLEEEKQLSKNVELEDTHHWMAKLRLKEKHEANLQLKCDRLQEELHNVRLCLQKHRLGCNVLHCHNAANH